MVTKKERLLAELEKIEQKEEKKKSAKRMKENYEAFKNRESIPFFGKAYCGQDDVTDNELANVCIHGNMGKTYYLEYKVPTVVETYFHNEWSNEEQQKFQEELNKLVKKYVTKQLNDPGVLCGLFALMGCSDLTEYPPNKRKEIKEELIKERNKIFDKSSIKQIKKAIALEEVYSVQPLVDYLKDREKKKGKRDKSKR